MDEIKGKAIAVADSYIRDARFAFIELENGIRLLGRILDDAGVGSQVVMVGCGIDSSSKKPYYIFKSLSDCTSNV